MIYFLLKIKNDKYGNNFSRKSEITSISKEELLSHTLMVIGIF